MTSNDQWKKAENYDYLTKLDGKNAVAGWAWEFIRRSKSYRDAYAEFDDLRQQYGQDWRANQPRDVFEPTKLPNETDNGWKYRVAGMGLVAEPISASQKRARTWQLADMYDPQQTYDKNHIRFTVGTPFPAFYAEPRPTNIPTVQAFEDLQHDYQDADTPHLLFAAFDVTRPINEQLKKAREILGQHRKAFAATRQYKGHKGKWVLYVRFLDARASDADLQLIDILKAVGIPKNMRDEPHAVASELFEQAQNMADEGYRGLLSKLENH